MTEQRYIYPDSYFHKQLEFIERGGGTLRVVERDLAMERRLKSQQSFLEEAGVIETLPPIEIKHPTGIGTYWSIGVRLTNLGEACMLTLSDGCVFDLETSSVDLLKTEEWYREFLTRDGILDFVLKLAIGLKNPFLDSVREEYVYFKMRATFVEKAGHWMIIES